MHYLDILEIGSVIVVGSIFMLLALNLLIDEFMPTEVECDFNSIGWDIPSFVASVEQRNYHEGQVVILVGDGMKALAKMYLLPKVTFDNEDWWEAKVIKWL